MFRFVRLFFFISLSLTTSFLFAQTQVKFYSFSSVAGTYTPISGIHSTAQGDEGVENGIPIGFNFFFGGKGYTHCTISSNGFIKLGYVATNLSGSHYTNLLTNAGNASSYYPLIAGIWDDNNRGSGSISYATTGTAGARVFTVQWNAVNIGNGGTASAAYAASFQIKLFESSNIVKIIYGNTLTFAGSLSASIGLNDLTSFLSVTPGTTATASSSAANNSIAATTNLNNKEYTFTPPAATCSPVTALTVSDITSSTALLTAATVNGATGYRFAVNTTGAIPTTSTLSTSPTFTLSGLTSNVTYYAQVQTACSGTDTSGWFTTPFIIPCVTTLPYLENFDGVTAPALPNCMTIQDVNGSTTWVNNRGFGNSGNNSMMYNYSGTLQANDWFYTPAVPLQSGTTYKLSYYQRTSAVTSKEKMEVKYGTANNAAAMTTTLTYDTSIFSASYVQVVKTFVPATSGNFYIGFHAFSDYQQINIYVDDIRVEVSTDCGLPTGLAVTLNPTGGAAHWTPPVLGTPNGYQYAVTSSSTPPASGTAVTDTTASFSGLQPSTTYYLHVRTTCTNGVTGSWASYAFITPCAAVNVPYTQNFSTVVTPALPSCYTVADMNGGNTWTTDSSSFGCTPTRALVYKDHAGLPADDWVILPGINLTAGTSYEISFDYKGCLSNYIEKLEVKYGMMNSPAALTNALFSNTNINFTSYQNGRAGFTPTVSGVYYFGFHAFSAANQYQLSVDNISVKVSTVCGQPRNPVATLTNNTDGSIRWNRPAENTAASYQYAISTSTVPPAMGTVVTDTTVNFSGLLAGRRYFFHLRASCTNGNTSDWTTMSFTTGCVPRTIPYTESFDSVPVPYLGNCMTLQDLNGGATWKTDTYKPRSAPNSMLYHFDPALPGNDWAYTPGLSLIKNVWYRLKFYYKGRNYNERLQVAWGSAATADSMTSIIWDNTFYDSTAYHLAQVDFKATQTGVFYLGFHALSAANQWDLNVDDISIDYAPGCGEPSSFRVTVTGSNTANISWGAPYNGPASGYEYQVAYTTTPAEFGIGTTDTTMDIFGLVPGNKIYVFVRSYCGNNTYSSWAMDSIYIPCTAQTPPYAENFDGVTPPVLAPCTSIQDVNGGSYWMNKRINPRSLPNCMVYSYDSNQPANDWFYTAPLNLTAGRVYRLKFYYKGRSSNLREKLEVKYGVTNSATAMTNFIFQDTSIQSTSYLRAEIDFAAATSGINYIGFHAISAADQFDLNVDDITLDVSPNCNRPGFLVITPTGYMSAIATWDSTAAGSIAGYEYLVDATPFTPEAGTITRQGHLDMPGLIPEFQYYFHIRTVCTTGSATSLWLTVPFKIPCGVYPLPYAQNFDFVFPPNLPPCITIQNLNGGNTWITEEDNANSAPVAMVYTGQGELTADDWFYTPTFNFTAGRSYRFSFYYKAGDAASIEKLEVKYGLGNNAAAMTNLLMRDTNINFSTYRFYQTDFIAPATGNYNIGFHAISPANRYKLYVDDISIDRSPACSQPVNLTVNLINGSGGSISWSPSTPGVTTGYEYLLDTVSSNPVTGGTFIPDHLYVLSGIQLFTQYYFHVRSICASGDTSIWVTTSFYTLPNDGPCNALSLVLNGPKNCGNTQMATAPQDPALPPGCNAPNFTIWYKYTAATNGSVILRTSIPQTQFPLYGSVGWYTLNGSCTDAFAFTLVPGSVCSSFGQTGSGDIDSLQSPVLTAGTTYYIMISGIDYNYGDFCLNLVSPPGNAHIYRFTGNGLWSNSNNWENQLVPPAYLPGGDMIIIDNAAGGKCVLDVAQYISNTGSLIINTGKKLEMSGFLKVQ